MKKLIIFIAAVFALYVALGERPIFSQSESLTITTYYPSPYGVYNRLLTNSLGVGDNNLSGSLDNSDTPDPTTHPGELWVANKIGVRTTSPIHTLDINGDIHATNDICTDLNGGKCLSSVAPSNVTVTYFKVDKSDLAGGTSYTRDIGQHDYCSLSGFAHFDRSAHHGERSCRVYQSSGTWKLNIWMVNYDSSEPHWCEAYCLDIP